MALASAVKLIDISRRRKIIRLLITASANYATGGDTLDLTATTNPNNLAAAQFGSTPNDSCLIYIPGGYEA